MENPSVTAAAAVSGADTSSLPKRRGRSVFWKQKVMGYAFLVPTAVLFFIFTVVPLIMSFYYAFTDYNKLEVYNMVGFQNFIDAVTRDEYKFLKSFGNVSLYALMVIPISIITSLGAAVLVSKKIPGVKAFRVLYYIPAVTSGVAVAYMWQWMFKEDMGLFNRVLALFGISPGPKWVNSPSYLSLFCIVIVSAWSSLGGNMLIFLAALNGVEPALYEAAEIDGATGFQRMMNVTLPMIAPTMYFILTMSIINAFQLFDLVYIMVPTGLPQIYTYTPVVYIYDFGFNNSEAGLGTAMSLILFAVIMLVTFVTQRFVKEDRTV